MIYYGKRKEGESMYNGKKVAVIMPAYNAAETLQKTYNEVLEQPFVDVVIIVDDASKDETEKVASSLPSPEKRVYFRMEKNRGYGGNQKTCYTLALKEKAEIVIMVHPDYQYTPLLIPAMTSMIGNGLYDCVLGSRILGGFALKGGMPLYKYVSNRFLTLFENFFTGAKLSEYHTGYRAFSGRLLTELMPSLEKNSDDFIFDNEMLTQILYTGVRIAEVSCPTKYFKEASSINFVRSCKYGLGCLYLSLLYRLCRMGLWKNYRFDPAKKDLLLPGGEK